MKRHNGKRLYSATDVVGYLECDFLTALDLRALDDAQLAAQRCASDESAELFARRGDQHESSYLDALRANGKSVVDVAAAGDSLEERVTRTIEAMRGGADIVYQAALRDGLLAGHADFLRRVDEGPSQFGSWSYEVIDTKLARAPKAEFLVQLAFYSQLLEKTQSYAPQRMHLALGDGSERSFRCADYMRYFNALLGRFLERVEPLGEAAPSNLYPLPTEHCDLCHWRDYCDAQWLADDHLCQVAGITRSQMTKLQSAGIATMAALGTVAADATVHRLNGETLAKLREQAALQDAARRTGERSAVVLSVDPNGRRGFHRLPQPDAGDIFFDMEGDPLQEEGLEYLFGVWFRQNGAWAFKCFWAHDRSQERRAFEDFMDLVTERLRNFPAAHIYHYASYEETALKRLASLHATREVEMDTLLRQGRLIDLYKVVREAIRISESSYSIKSVEHFYRPPRAGHVKDAGASLVCYERWRETADPALLADIQTYNRDDVESTQQLREWLLTLKPAGVPWRASGRADHGDTEKEAPVSARTQEIEARLATYRAKLVDSLPADRDSWTPDDHISELTYQLLDFHRRAAKPAWWAIFSRMDMSEEDLLEDPECLAGLVLDPANPPAAVKRSTQYTYLVPEQESKLLAGADCARCDTAQAIGRLQFDETSRLARLKIGPTKQPLPERLSIGPGFPINTDAITEAIYRFADNLLNGDARYGALDDLLRRAPPRLAGRERGTPVIEDRDDLVESSVAAVRSLEGSCLYVQGPPGSGKTHTGSHMIAALLADGRKVGVVSNSHKAINLLMARSIRASMAQGTAVRAIKKASAGNAETELDEPGVPVQNVYLNADVLGSDANLVGGTAWLFSAPEMDQSLDYLFVDEAGQVALANLIAVGTSARNIVLLGDQMQLGQPVQGVHPGRSGDSALDYLLDGSATISAERGIFLATTWRMHPAVCRFISEAIYEGRLLPQERNVRRTLVLRDGAHPLLQPSGVVHAPIDHSGCSQRSEEEVQLVEEIYSSLLHQRYTDRDGVEHALGDANILVVAPYNLQVNALKRALPPNARVGTVDKFQGQEAEVVIVSMTTSSEQDLPRHIEFLYSKNRLNVAISRAKCLAIVVANPALLAIKCRTPAQMALVNTLCWVAESGQPATQLSA